jgi:non-lysosomal glucosylceramidase
MVLEQLGDGCSGVPRIDAGAGGRELGDVSSMFVVYVLELVRWGGAPALARELWPQVRRAAQWQIGRSAEIGVPQFLCDTYDNLNFIAYKASAFSALFHVLAMRAAEPLALMNGDNAFADTLREAGQRATAAVDELFWTGGYYRAVTGST